MDCATCSTELRADARFCPVCGSAVSAKGAPGSMVDIGASSPDPPRKPSMALVVGGVTAVALLAALVVVLVRDDGSRVNTAGPSTESSEERNGSGEVGTTVVPGPVPGSLASAEGAIRAACREYYGFDLDADFNNIPLSEDALVDRCGEPPIIWQSDCYADRPPAFVESVGGCAVLGGYLAVWHETTATIEGVDSEDRRFRAGDDSWFIVPESD